MGIAHGATGRNMLLRFLKIAGVTAYAALFYVCWHWFYSHEMQLVYGWRGNYALTCVYGLLLTYLIRVYNGFDVGLLRISEIVYSQALAALICNLCTYIVLVFLCEHLLNPLALIGLQTVQTMAIAAWAVFAHRCNAKGAKEQPTAIIYRQESDLNKVRAIPYFAQKYAEKLRVCNPQNYRHAIEQLNTKKGIIKTVFIAGVDATTRNGILKYCLDEGICAYAVPKIGDILMHGAKQYCVRGEIFMRVQRPALTPEYRLIKRGFDILASLIGIVITSPFMLMAAVAIKLNDGGPVLYKQTRLTIGGREFRIWKFRSMIVGAEENGVVRLASEHDGRITPVGKIIRAYRMDELPQLFNILGGSMSLVGPRPERPEIAKEYERKLSAFSLRLQVKAGLTGYAQVYGRYNSEPYEKLRMDLMYINNMSVIEDLKLILATIKILFMRESTAGISEGQTTASAGKTEKSA